MTKTKPIKRGVKWNKYWAEFSLETIPIIKGPNIPLPNYRQLDIHSCGFIAALTVAKYLNPKTTPMSVLQVTRPEEGWGVSLNPMMKALTKLGVNTHYRCDINVPELIQLVRLGIPVIVSVYPQDWGSDHWCVVRGFSKNCKTIYLSNYKRVSVEAFEWYEFGEGIVCTRSES